MASTSSKRTTTHDVFISFRGPDTRKGFTHRFNDVLTKKGVKTFIDDGIEKGAKIFEHLMEKIEESKIYVVIFSKNYGSSSWCLDELVKIMECKESMDRKVLPIFLYVEPQHVRHQKSEFGDAFNRLRERFENRMDIWKDVLRATAGLSGWNLGNYRSESDLIDEVVIEIEKILYPVSSSTASNGFVGIDSCIQELQSWCVDDPTIVRFIGIWGMGGIGKTTIAQVLLSQISIKFDCACFLSSVRSKNDIVALRQELFSKLLSDKNLRIEMPELLPRSVIVRLKRRKVLVVLDDVDKSTQLDALAGDHGWFGPGSRVVVTSRDREVLNRCDETYAVEVLKYCDALQLLSRLAFKKEHPPEDYDMLLTERVLNYAKGVPLAVKILGSHLYKKSPNDWQSLLNKLKQSPDDGIMSVLKTSYDDLEQPEKDMFLDIACFFKGYVLDRLKSILASCGFSDWGITRLVEKSLVSVVDNRIEMHDLIQEMGQHIARHNRVCNSMEFRNMLTTEGKRAAELVEGIEGISIDMSELENEQLNHEAFSRMPNLRILKLYKSQFKGSSIFESDEPKQLQFNSKKLTVFHWDYYPYKSLPSNIFMGNVVELKLEESKVEQLWDKDKHLPRLKLLDLRFSKQLKTLPVLSLASNLEEIFLMDCQSLINIPSSIQCLHKLNALNLEGCRELQSVPSLAQLESLTFLRLYECSKLHPLPDLPGSIEDLNLSSMSVSSSDLRPICQFKCLETLDLSWCSYVREFPDFNSFSLTLRKLYLDGTSLVELPRNMDSLSSLKILNIRYCRLLKALPKLPSGLKILQADCCKVLETVSASSVTSIQLDDETREFSFTFRNCEMLDGSARCNIMRDALWRIERLANGCNKEKKKDVDFQVIVPGSVIPEWFKFQREGSSLSIAGSNLLPPPSGYIVFVLCIIVELEFHPTQLGWLSVGCKVIVNENIKETTEVSKIEFLNRDWLYNAAKRKASEYAFIWYIEPECRWLTGNDWKVNGVSFYFTAVFHDICKQSRVKYKVKTCGVHLIDHISQSNSDSTSKQGRMPLMVYSRRGSNSKENRRNWIWNQEISPHQQN